MRLGHVDRLGQDLLEVPELLEEKVLGSSKEGPGITRTPESKRRGD